MWDMISTASGQMSETEFDMLKNNSRMLNICADYLRTALTTYQESAESYTHKVLSGIMAQEHVDMMTQARHTGSDTMAQISTIV